MAGSSDLAVVIVSLVGGEALARCIERLPLTEVACVAVLKDAASDVALWARRYPRVRFLPGRDEPVPLRRKRGLDATTAPLVGFIEDTSWPERDWCNATLAAFADPGVASAAGPVAIAPFLTDRCHAFAWIEFGDFAPGISAPAAAGRVPANAMVFRRADLASVMGDDPGLSEDAICRRLRDRGRTIARVDAMKVTYSACDENAASIADRFERGRMSAAGGPVPGFGGRVKAFSRAVAIAVSLTARDLRRIKRTSPQQQTFPFLLMWLALLEGAWAFGAARGATAGPGDAAKALR